MLLAGEGNHPPQLNFLPWKCIQSCKSHIYLPGLITSNAFAMCLQYIQGDVSDYHSSLSNYKTHQSKANRSWDIWHLREEQAAGLPPVPGLPWCQEGPLSPTDFRALELSIQTFWDAVAPALLHVTYKSSMLCSWHPQGIQITAAFCTTQLCCEY